MYYLFLFILCIGIIFFGGLVLRFLPFILLAFLILYVISYFKLKKRRKETQDYYENVFSDFNNTDYTNRRSKSSNPDVIDAEYTERDIEE